MSSIRAESVEGWQRMRGLCEAVFYLDRRLPSVVSRLPSPDAPFFDGDIIFGGMGWDLASSLALTHGDSTVNLLMVDPDPAEFFGSTGRFGFISCASTASKDCYVAGLFGHPRGAADQIGYVADTVAIVGTSGRWGIWVERNVAGLVVSATPSTLAAWELENGPFLDAGDAIDGFLGVNLGGCAHDSEFASMLRRNYAVFRDERQDDA